MHFDEARKVANQKAPKFPVQGYRTVCLVRQQDVLALPGNSIWAKLKFLLANWKPSIHPPILLVLPQYINIRLFGRILGRSYTRSNTKQSGEMFLTYNNFFHDVSMMRYIKPLADGGYFIPEVAQFEHFPEQEDLDVRFFDSDFVSKSLCIRQALLVPAVRDIKPYAVAHHGESELPVGFFAELQQVPFPFELLHSSELEQRMNGVRPFVPPVAEAAINTKADPAFKKTPSPHNSPRRKSQTSPNSKKRKSSPSNENSDSSPIAKRTKLDVVALEPWPPVPDSLPIQPLSFVGTKPRFSSVEEEESTTAADHDTEHGMMPTEFEMEAQIGSSEEMDSNSVDEQFELSDFADEFSDDFARANEVFSWTDSAVDEIDEMLFL